MASSEQEVSKFLKPRSVLIVTENTTDRTAWKKLFHELGTQTSNFYNANSLAEAMDIINSNEIHIVFSSYTMAETPVMELVDRHNMKYPDRSNFLYFMASEKNSLAVSACAAEHDIDPLIIKPYTLSDLNAQVINAINKKINMKKEERFYYNIQELLITHQIDDAKEKIEKYKEMRPDSASPLYLEGSCQKMSGDLGGAISTWEKALTKDPLHHKTLTNIFDTNIEQKKFTNAYEHAQILCDKYPINPERIPNFIRVSLAMKNYQNLIDFCEMILEVEADLEGIQRPIAAALAISAKNLAGDEEHYELVKKSSLKSADLTEPTSKIFSTAIENLIACGDIISAQKLLDQIPSDEMTEELQFLELKILSKDETNNQQVFMKIQNLIKLGYETAELYEMYLNSAKILGKKESFLEDVVFDAVKKFPEREENFKSFL